MSEGGAHEEVLRAVGDQADADINIAETALALGGLDRPGVPLARYQAHLDEIGRDIGDAAPDNADAATAAAALREVMSEEYGYRGDEQTYDDMQNANLLRVIDRRKGLPVALAILYMHAARHRGWSMWGLNFPAHFLVRLEVEGARLILDPFRGGRVVDTPDLRELLKRLAGDGAELRNDYYQIVGDRDVLLRLQNNIKTRALQQNDLGRAVEIVRRMLLLAPQRYRLYRELGLIEAHAGNMQNAIAAAESYATQAVGDSERHDAAMLLQKLRSSLN